LGSFRAFLPGAAALLLRESSPVRRDVRKDFLRRIDDLNQTTSAPEFWNLLLLCWNDQLSRNRGFTR